MCKSRRPGFQYEAIIRIYCAAKRYRAHARSVIERYLRDPVEAARELEFSAQADSPAHSGLIGGRRYRCLEVGTGEGESCRRVEKAQTLHALHSQSENGDRDSESPSPQEFQPERQDVGMNSGAMSRGRDGLDKRVC